MNRICLAWIWMFATTGAIFADLDWFNFESNQLQYANGGALHGDADPQAACFVQLICAGGDRTNNPAIGTGDGVTGDDSVADQSFCGDNIPFGNLDGWLFASALSEDLTDGEWYYVRAWTAPASDFLQGSVPVSGTNRYADSSLHLYVETGPIGFADEFNFGGEGLFANRIPGADSDGDGMPDWWEFVYCRSLTGAVADADLDLDGQNNADEYIADTIPTNGESVLELIAPPPSEAGRVAIAWRGVTSRVYSVERAAGMDADYETLATNVAGDAAINVFTNADDEASFRSYRVRTRLP